MKNAENNEIDLLLRFLARNRPNKPSVRAGSGLASEDLNVAEHLDIDELSSYAEGVLTVLARARYSEHLADCERCRRIVIALSQTAGMTRQLEGSERGKLKLWEKISAVFSPPVLRYAIPALVLTAAIAIGLFALRPQPRPELVAQKQPLSSTDDSKAPPQADSQPTEASPSKLTGAAPTANTGSTREKINVPADEVNPIQTPRTGAGSGEIASSLKDSPQSKSTGVPELPSYAPEPPPAKSVAPLLQPSSQADQVRRVPKSATAEREQQQRGRDQSESEFGYASPSPSPARTDFGTRGTGRIAGLAAENKSASRAEEKDKKEARDEAETRKVSGRWFRHRGNAWVDTAYESPREVINVARGSEQFRSLVGDEPPIRSIAEQLRGQIIVVWKGQAYRIY